MTFQPCIIVTFDHFWHYAIKRFHSIFFLRTLHALVYIVSCRLCSCSQACLHIWTPECEKVKKGKDNNEKTKKKQDGVYIKPVTLQRFNDRSKNNKARY